MSHGQVRALVFGAHGEGSPDVHHSIEASARQRARQTWRSFGARTEEEAYGYWVQQFRRLMGVTIVREFARLRIQRVPRGSSLARSECRASSCATGREAGGWCRRCRPTVVTRATSSGIRGGCSRGEVWGGA